MQKLTVTEKDRETGREKTVIVTVLRAWTFKNRTIYLHSNGIYGNKNGSPVSSKEQLESVITGKHLKAALNWWERTGKGLAASAKTEEVVRADSSMPLYISYTGTKPKRTEPAQDWSAYGFPKKPEWWGDADLITIGGVTYELEKTDGEPVAKTPVSADNF